MSPIPPPRRLLACFAAALGLLLLPGEGSAQPAESWHVTLDVHPLTDPSAGFNAHPTFEHRLTLVLSYWELDCHGLAFGAPQVTGDRIRIEASRVPTGPDPCTLGRGARAYQELRVAPLGEGGAYTVEVRLADELLLSQPLEVWFPARTLLFTGGDGASRYNIEVRALLTDPRVVSAPREAASVRLNPVAGYFWFFDSDNVEVTVKVLDGRAVDGKLWLFVTGMTDLGLTVEVRASGTCSGGPCPTHRYVNAPGGHLVVVDGIEAGE